MRFVVKQPGAWNWQTIVTDSLAAEVEKGRVRSDWLIRVEGESGESTVEQLLAALDATPSGTPDAVSIDEVVVLGMGRRVAAISKSDGRILWSTEVSNGLGNPFVTLVIDGQRVFAGCAGLLHCLDLATGSLIWTNELPGYGYGLASLCLPGGESSPSPEVAQRLAEEEQKRRAT
jgi:outer membrane protein assembly factor BamB